MTRSDAVSATATSDAEPSGRGTGQESAAGSTTVAQVIASVLSPALLAGTLLLSSGAVSSHWRGLGWAGLTAVVMLGLPMTVLILLARRGVVDTRYVRDRRHRFPVYGGVSVLAIAVLLAQYVLGPGLGIPLAVTLTATFLLIGVVVLMLITLVWKVSAHGAMAGTFAVGVPLLLGGWLLALTWMVPVAVAWSRVRTSDHTYWQTVVGTWIGVLIGGFYGLVWHLWI